jgi:hypothetical protein
MLQKCKKAHYRMLPGKVIFGEEEFRSDFMHVQQNGASHQLRDKSRKDEEIRQIVDLYDVVSVLNMKAAQVEKSQEAEIDILKNIAQKRASELFNRQFVDSYPG